MSAVTSFAADFIASHTDSVTVVVGIAAMLLASIVSGFAAQVALRLEQRHG
jgi:hypothetical protein